MRTLRIISPLVLAVSGLAQTAHSTILNIEVADHVVYIYDVPDYSRLASDPGKTPNPGASRAFSSFISIGDVVAVNGEPVRGTWVQHATALRLTTALVPGSSIADVTRFGLSEWMCEILRPDGNPIGTLMASGTIFGSPAPGAPLSSAGHNLTITGGTGAFLGARGQATDSRLNFRNASITEDHQTGGSMVAARPILSFFTLFPLPNRRWFRTRVGQRSSMRTISVR